MRKFLSASSLKQDEPRPPGWMHGMCQSFAKIVRNPAPPPSDRANLQQNGRKSQPVSIKITLLANLFYAGDCTVSPCGLCVISNE
jgi:hypothetical protein